MSANLEKAFGGTSQALGLIELIYAAVQRPELWSTVLERMAEAIHGESLSLFARLPSEALISMARTDPFAWDEYVSYYSSVNPLMEACDARFEDGEVRYAHQVMTDSQLEKTEFYNDFFKPYNMHYSMGIKIPLPDNLPAAYMSCQRPQAKGAFDEQEGIVYRTLLPHLRNALSLYMQFSTMQSKVLGLETALDAFGHAVFGLDGHGRIIVSNRQAEELLRQGGAFRLVGTSLTTYFPEQSGRFEGLITAAVAAGAVTGMSAGGSMLVYRNSGKEPLRVTVTPFSSSLPGRAVQLAALVFVSDPAGRSQAKAAILTALYGLTPTEGRVADLLSQGLEVREISNALGCTLETARFHVKRILSKTGTRKQTELMRLMLSLPGL